MFFWLDFRILLPNYTHARDITSALFTFKLVQKRVQAQHHIPINWIFENSTLIVLWNNHSSIILCRMIHALLVLTIGILLGAVVGTSFARNDDNRIAKAWSWTASHVGRQFLPAAMTDIKKRIKYISLAAGTLFMLWLLGFIVVRSVMLFNGMSEPLARWHTAPPSDSTEGVVVIVHGWQRNAQAMESVADIAERVYPEHAIFLWEYEAGIFSNENADAISGRLVRDVQKITNNTDEIILIGHSLGGLLVRRAYLDALDSKTPETWGAQVSRIALMAAPNRGTRALYRSPVLSIADAIAQTYGAGDLIRSTHRGHPFVVNLRLKWIKQFSEMEHPPVVAQVLGRDDTIVGLGDSRDILQFPNAVERLAHGVGHTDVISNDDALEILAEVLITQPNQTQSISAETKDPKVFKALLVHGIRDYAESFDQLQKIIEQKSRDRGMTPIVTSPRYPYFSALQFIIPWERRAKVHHFADIYAELAATSPTNAPINVVGHSFGSYLLGKSLMKYEEIDYGRVYLAGSVLNQQFPWDAKRTQWKLIRNDTATLDWPVGILCSCLGKLGLAEHIGTGGFDGFGMLTGIPEDIWTENKLEGGHGVFNKHHDNIATWITMPNPTTENKPLKTIMPLAQNSNLFKFFSRSAGVIGILLIALFTYLFLAGQHPEIAAIEMLGLLILLSIL